MSDTRTDGGLFRAPIAVVLAWLVPGLGHLFLGHKTRGIIFLVAITLTFWTGVAIGGVRSVSLQPAPKPSPGTQQMETGQSWWFLAQVFNGSFAITCYAVSKSPRADYLSWPSGDVASVYTGVAGLLNLLIILDALARAEGLPAAARSPSGGRGSTGPPDPRGKRRG